MEKIRKAFKDYFAPQGVVELPDPLPQRGTVRAAGWIVRFVRGEEDGQPYVDCYAQNRMTNSRHFRIHADGEIEGLENYREGIVLDESTGDDMSKAAAAADQHNRKVTRILEEKGLLED